MKRDTKSDGQRLPAAKDKETDYSGGYFSYTANNSIQRVVMEAMAAKLPHRFP
jgi:hypothetical protein